MSIINKLLNSRLNFKSWNIFEGVMFWRLLIVFFFPNDTIFQKLLMLCQNWAFCAEDGFWMLGCLEWRLIAFWNWRIFWNFFKSILKSCFCPFEFFAYLFKISSPTAFSRWCSRACRWKLRADWRVAHVKDVGPIGTNACIWLAAKNSRMTSWFFSICNKVERNSLDFRCWSC